MRVRCLEILDECCRNVLCDLFNNLFDFIEAHEQRRSTDRRSRANYEALFPDVKRNLIHITETLATISSVILDFGDGDAWTGKLTVLCKTFYAESLRWLGITMGEMNGPSLRSRDMGNGLQSFGGQSIVIFHWDLVDGLRRHSAH